MQPIPHPEPQPGTGLPGVGALFGGFFSIGICGFGGTLPWARRMVVEQRGWLAASEFTDLLALCQFLPGPNIVNFAVCLGARFRGPAGAAAALAGLLSAPMVIVMTLGALYGAYGGHAVVGRAFHGLAAAASGLVLATALQIAAPLRGRALGLAVAGVALLAIAVLRLPLLPTMLVLAPLSVALHRTPR
ncbi:MAG: chromate transporter [Rhodospirillales bacterium 70-18]|nr:chromate transporter [Rhodospirillales bacterium]OJY64215.1 MAG: chromate transporter [Rhodospirillales bacterium 70-18]